MLSLALALAALAPVAALAAARESFEYPPGPVAAPDGGTGFAGPWNFPFAPVYSEVVSGSLSDPTGLLATSGNHIQAKGGIQRMRRLTETVGTPGTDLWLSYLVRRDQVALGWSGLGLIPSTTGNSWTGPALLIGEPGSGPADGTWGIGEYGRDDTFVSSGVPLRAGETTFLVAHVHFTDFSTTGLYDTATLFVNPTPGVEPTGGVTYGRFDFAPFDGPMIHMAFSDNTQTGIGIAFDELRVGSSYAEVAPAAPEPSAVALTLPAALAAMRRRRRRGED